MLSLFFLFVFSFFSRFFGFFYLFFGFFFGVCFNRHGLVLDGGRLGLIGTLVAAAPLLGLLGTVMGMLQTFFGISTSGGSETAGVVAAGISEALVTTQTGLTLALPGLFIVMMIQRQRHHLEAKLARLVTIFEIAHRWARAVAVGTGKAGRAAETFLDAESDPDLDAATVREAVEALQAMA